MNLDEIQKLTDQELALSILKFGEPDPRKRKIGVPVRSMERLCKLLAYIVDQPPPTTEDERKAFLERIRTTPQGKRQASEALLYMLTN